MESNFLIDFLLVVGMCTCVYFFIKYLILQSRCCYWAARDATFIACNFKKGLTIRVKVLAVIKQFFFTLFNTFKNELRGQKRLKTK